MNSRTYPDEVYFWFRSLCLAHKLIDDEGIPTWKLGWTDRWSSRNSRTQGLCEPTKKRITLAVELLNFPAAKVRDVLLHEFAHALRNAEHRDEHDIVWARIAVNLGCQLQFATDGYDREILRAAKAERRKSDEHAR